MVDLISSQITYSYKNPFVSFIQRASFTDSVKRRNLIVPEMKSPTTWRYYTCITVATVKETHFESNTSAITILPVLAQIEDPPEFLLKHHVQREGMHIRKSSVDFFVEI